MTTDCQHNTIKHNVSQTKKLGKLSFEYKTDVCSDCGSALWNNEVEAEYVKWVSENKEKFIIQLMLPPSVEVALGKMANKLRVDVSKVIKAMLSVYIDNVFSDEHLSIVMSKLDSDEIFKKFTQDPVKKNRTSVRLSANLWELSETWAALSGMSHLQFVKDCILRMLTLFESEEQYTKVAQDFDKQLNTVVKAA